jgi:hypothetical protein
MPYLQLAFPPGILRNGTEYESKGRWFGCNQIRFVEGVILRRGDGVKHSTSAVTGKGRKIIAWRDNSLTRWHTRTPRTCSRYNADDSDAAVSQSRLNGSFGPVRFRWPNRVGFKFRIGVAALRPKLALPGAFQQGAIDGADLRAAVDAPAILARPF